MGVLRGLTITFNVLFMLLGLAMAGIGCWVRFKKTQYDELLGDMLPLATYMAIGAGAFVAALAMLGCTGAMLKNKKILTLYFALLLVLFLVQATAAVLGFMMFDQLRPKVGKLVVEAVKDKYGYEKYKMLTDAIDFMQHEMMCCGYNSSLDWDGSKYFTEEEFAEERGSLVLPRSCCRHVNMVGCGETHNRTIIFQRGCVDQIVDIFHVNARLIGGFGLAVALLELFGMAISAFLCCSAD